MAKKKETGPRRQGREMAMKMLYQSVVGKQELEAASESFPEFLRAPEAVRKFAIGLAQGVLLHEKELDGKIEEALKKWKFERLAVIDIQLMRVALFEILYSGDIPANVAIDEAIELAKVYSGTPSAKFVNGVLGTLAQKYAPGKLGADKEKTE